MNRRILLIILSLCFTFALTACELPGIGGEKVDPGWVYEEVDGGVMITGYTGDAEVPSIPWEIDGKEVVSIKSGDNYNFTAVSLYPFNCLYKGEDGSFYLNSNGGDRVIQLRGSLASRVGFNLFFGKNSIKVVNDMECDICYEDFTTEDFVNVSWELSGSEAHPYSISLLFSEDGKVLVKDHGAEVETEGSYTYSQGIITMNFGGETTEFMLFGDDLVCWEADNYFARIMDEPYLTVFELPDFDRLFLSVPNTGAFWQKVSLPGGQAGECTVTFGTSKDSENPEDNISQVIPTITITHDGRDSTLFPAGTYEYKIMGNRITFGENYMYSFRLLDGDMLQDGHNNVYVMTYPEK